MLCKTASDTVFRDKLNEYRARNALRQFDFAVFALLIGVVVLTNAI
ncbi:MAG: hypothetical protein ACFBSD_11140 [Paracoccaceae bacterium]